MVLIGLQTRKMIYTAPLITSRMIDNTEQWFSHRIHLPEDRSVYYREDTAYPVTQATLTPSDTTTSAMAEMRAAHEYC